MTVLADKTIQITIAIARQVHQGCRDRRLLVQAVNNAKQLFYLMVEFDQDFGEFPSDDTAGEIKGGEEYKGKHSNDYLGQLIVAGYTTIEEIFYVEKGAKKRPDNKIGTKAQTLAAGECGFAYILGQSTSSPSGRPLLCAPMTGKGTKFDPQVFGGKALVLRIDGSVKTYDIDFVGHVNNFLNFTLTEQRKLYSLYNISVVYWCWFVSLARLMYLLLYLCVCCLQQSLGFFCGQSPN